MLVPKCLLRYMVEVQNVFIELTFEVQLSTINIMQVKKQGGKNYRLESIRESSSRRKWRISSFRGIRTDHQWEAGPLCVVGE